MKKLNREQGMIDVIDALCPVPDLSYDDAVKLARLCEAVVRLYEKGGSIHYSGLGLTVKPPKLKEEFWAEARTSEAESDSV
jgi:hypothetical protein